MNFGINTAKMDEITIPLSAEFKAICQEIIDKNFSENDWAEIESDDMFQSDTFEGGFDATENAFTFSYFLNGKEYWFQLTLEEITQVNAGKNVLLKGRLADHFV